jgi:hypothetical protein
MLLVVGHQSIFDNSERTSLEAHPLMKGGTLNGKTPNLPFVRGDDGKKVTTLIQRAAHCYLYNASVNQMPTGGCQITYDNQVQLNPTTKRKGGPHLPGVPVNPAGVAYVAFEPLAGEDYVLGTSASWRRQSVSGLKLKGTRDWILSTICVVYLVMKQRKINRLWLIQEMKTKSPVQ